MKCPKCNAEVREGAKFCTSCGNRLAVMSGKTEEPVNGNSENENNPAKRNEAEQRDGITNTHTTDLTESSFRKGLRHISVPTDIRLPP